MKKFFLCSLRIVSVILLIGSAGLLVTMLGISMSTGEKFGDVGADFWARATERDDDHHAHGR